MTIPQNCHVVAYHAGIRQLMRQHAIDRIEQMRFERDDERRQLLTVVFAIYEARNSRACR